MKRLYIFRNGGCILLQRELQQSVRVRLCQLGKQACPNPRFVGYYTSTVSCFARH